VARCDRRDRAAGSRDDAGTVPTLLDEPPRIASGPGSPHAPLSRFLLIGDVHAEDERLEAALALGARERCEAALCVGDVADGYGDLERTIAILEDARVRVVRGNHDRWLVANEMRTLVPTQDPARCPRAVSTARLWPPVLEVATTRGLLLLCHAIADDDMAVLEAHTREDDVRAVPAWRALAARGRHRFMAAGHTHEVMVRTLDGVTILNGGTLKRDDDPRVAVVDLAAGELHVHDLEDPAIPYHLFTIVV
jgi:predicted phosphodiesterase